MRHVSALDMALDLLDLTYGASRPTLGGSGETTGVCATVVKGGGGHEIVDRSHRPGQ